MRIFNVLLLIVFIAGGVYLVKNPQLLNAVEKNPPLLAASEIPKGLGVGESKLSFRLQDPGAGLKSIRISLEQAGKVVIAEDKTFSTPVPKYHAQTSFQNLRRNFKEAKAEIRVEATDASIWGNKLEKRYEVVLDFEKPKIAVLSQQHLANQGGAEFVIVEARDTALSEVGAQVSDYHFTAVPLEDFDARFAGRSLYAVLLAFPLEIEDATPEVFAKDAVGNVTSIPLRFPIKDYRQAETTPRISDSFIQQKVEPLYREYLDSLPAEQQAELESDEPAKIFRVVNENYRQYLQKQLNELELSTTPLPTGVFHKPMASATTSNYGELRTYQLNGEAISNSRHDGLDLASVLRDSVVASHKGKVLLARSFGIYGNAVVVDHGLGLTSIYGHLSSIAVAEGDQVTRGQELGRSGETGLAGGDHLHFEFRIGQVPVDPKEWWDSHWLEDNISGKLAAVADAFGLDKAQDGSAATQ